MQYGLMQGIFLVETYTRKESYGKHHRIVRIWFTGISRRYPYFDIVVGLVWSHDPESCAGSSVCYW
jgi:hypothetical protein